jgi:hypothetical protein
VTQRVGRGIALLFHDRGTRRWRVVSSTPRPHFTPGKDPVSTVQQSVWAPAAVWKAGKSRRHRYSIPDRPGRSQSIYRLTYPAHTNIYLLTAWCRVVLEKLTSLQLVKKFPEFHLTRRFINALTSVRHLSLSWASPLQSTYP